jgi:hypothetical protein
MQQLARSNDKYWIIRKMELPALCERFGLSFPETEELTVLRAKSREPEHFHW